jgi:hypothetical protein
LLVSPIQNTFVSVHTLCDSRTASVFVSEVSEGVKTATLSFKLNYARAGSLDQSTGREGIEDAEVRQQ